MSKVKRYWVTDDGQMLEAEIDDLPCIGIGAKCPQCEAQPLSARYPLDASEALRGHFGNLENRMITMIDHECLTESAKEGTPEKREPIYFCSPTTGEGMRHGHRFPERWLEVDGAALVVRTTNTGERLNGTIATKENA